MKIIPDNLKRWLQIAYAPSKVGVSYESAAVKLTTKAVVESLTAVLVLYASYSELTEKILKTFWSEESPSALLIVRAIACAFGIFVSLHIIFAVQNIDAAKRFVYSQVQRGWAYLTFLLATVSLVIVVWGFFHQPQTTVGRVGLSYETPGNEWTPLSTQDGADARTYRYRIRLPKEAKRYRTLKVLILTNQGFVIKGSSAFHKPDKPITQDEEPMRGVGSGANSVTWTFSDFNPANEWQIEVAIAANNSTTRFSDDLPFQATISFYQ